MTSCPVCGYLSREFVDLGTRHIFKCVNKKCLLKFVDRIPSRAELETLYKDLYFGESPFYSSTSDAFFCQIIKLMHKEVIPLTGKKILDYGCGQGTFLISARKEGLSADGLDPHLSEKNKLSMGSGGRIYSNIEEIVRDGTRYELVFMSEVIEHLPRPWEDLAQIRKVMSKNGLICIFTPDSDCLRASFLKNRWENYLNPTHIFFFNESSLRSLMHKAGFEELKRWRPMIVYPAHTTLRRMFQTILQKMRLDGAIRMIGKA